MNLLIVPKAPLDQRPRCPVCRSSKLNTHKAEITLVLPKLENLRKPPLFLHADAVVCSECGFAQFSVPESQRKSLTHVQSERLGPGKSANRKSSV
jgi:hypothetical protein